MEKITGKVEKGIPKIHIHWSTKKAKKSMVTMQYLASLLGLKYTDPITQINKKRLTLLQR